MNNKSCPISLISIDSNVARINAFYTGVLVVIFLFTLQTPIIYFLVLDFFLKVAQKKEYSLLFILALRTKNILKLASKKVDAAPKRLAALFGLLFSILIAVTALAEFVTVMYVLVVVLLACIFLEVAFNYCLGCEIYYLYKRFLS